MSIIDSNIIFGSFGQSTLKIRMQLNPDFYRGLHRSVQQHIHTRVKYMVAAEDALRAQRACERAGCTRASRTLVTLAPLVYAMFYRLNGDQVGLRVYY